MQASKLARVSTETGPYSTTLLGQISDGKHVRSVLKGEVIFSQGDQAETVYFLESGRVKVSVVSSTGKEAVLVIMGPNDFFGEECLIGQSCRMSAATALEPSLMFQVQKTAMLSALHAHPEFSQRFAISLLQRTVDLKEDLCDQLFNYSEKRLARVLLKLAREYEACPDATMPNLSHETLAEMVGTTRSRITHFMNKFRKSGMIDYDGHLIVIKEQLANVVSLEF